MVSTPTLFCRTPARVAIGRRLLPVWLGTRLNRHSSDFRPIDVIFYPWRLYGNPIVAPPLR
jgi:hypothetical protein